MKSHAQVVVIGGGVVGCSVLYHLTKAGWRDVVLIERSELTSGSSWHAAGNVHTFNLDPNVARLQQYTIKLYKEIEAISGQSCGLHITGGLMLAGTEDRLDWLKQAHARSRYLEMETQLVSPSEAARIFPLMDKKCFVGALYDPIEGHVDPAGVTNAYAKAARIQGAEVYRFTRVTELAQRSDASWDVVTDKGTRGWPNGRPRVAGVGHGAPVHHHRGDSRSDGVSQGDAPCDRLRGRDLHAPGGQRHALGHIRARWRAVVGAGHAVGFHA
jgi:dimethylglycine dehydrogenase